MAEYVTECNTKKWRAEIDAWKNEHPLTMKNRPLMGPLDIFNEINKQFDKVIIVTDVGQHQMLTSQFVDITENRKLVMSGGLDFREQSVHRLVIQVLLSSPFPVMAVCR